jgi:hypothetical protein
MSDRLIPHLTATQIAVRVAFSCAVTAFVAIGAYVLINWTAGAHR